MNAVAHMFQKTVVQQGRQQATDRKVRPIIEVPLRSCGCGDTFWVAGQPNTRLLSDPTKPYIHCDRANGTAWESTVPPGSSLPDNIEIYEKAKTFGNQHVPGM